MNTDPWGTKAGIIAGLRAARDRLREALATAQRAGEGTTDITRDIETAIKSVEARIRQLGVQP